MISISGVKPIILFYFALNHIEKRYWYSGITNYSLVKCNLSLDIFYKNYSKLIPEIGKIVVGQKKPYEYLVKSIENFLDQKQLVEYRANIKLIISIRISLYQFHPKIHLTDYFTALVGDKYTVNLTPHGPYYVYVKESNKNTEENVFRLTPEAKALAKNFSSACDNWWTFYASHSITLSNSFHQFHRLRRTNFV